MIVFEIFISIIFFLLLTSNVNNVIFKICSISNANFSYFFCSHSKDPKYFTHHHSPLISHEVMGLAYLKIEINNEC